MYTSLRKIAEKAMGEITYSELGKNTYLVLPGPSDPRHSFSKKNGFSP